MKIVYLTPGCFDKGGISRYNRYQIGALRDIVGTENVRVFSVLGPDRDSFEAPFAVEFAAGGLRHREKASFVAHATAACLTFRPDIVLSAHVNLSGLGRILSSVVGAKSILNIYGSEVWSGFRADSRWGLMRADHVIADCHFTARYVENAGLRASRSTSVVWDCVDLERFTPRAPRPEVLARYGIPAPETGFNLLTLGRMSTDAGHKGYERLFRVFERIAPLVPDLRVIFAGRGNLVEILRGRARDAGLADRVYLTGGVHEDDLADVYRSAHLFSLVSDRGPGRGEGIPLTPLEAAACGVPILVGNQDGSQEAVVGGENGVVLDPFDLVGHGDAIVSLVRDRERRSSMAAGAARIARSSFGFGRFRDEHRALLRNWFPSKAMAA